MKKISYFLEAIGLFLAFSLFRVIGLDAASSVGGWIGRTFGPRLAASRKAHVNLEKSLPDLDQAAIISEMWDNLGRVIAEYPYLKKIVHERLDITGAEHLEQIGKDKPFILIGGHLANWELVPVSMNYNLQSTVSAIFREPNNPYAAKMLDRLRNFEDKGIYIPKSQSGARDMVETIRSGGRIAILIDQKYNQGKAVEFFGRPAMTTTAPAQLALKYKLPILPMQIVRDGKRLRVIIHPPMDTDGKDEATIMRDANALLEGWIRQHPGQWLWLHRRWDSKGAQQLP